MKQRLALFVGLLLTTSALSHASNFNTLKDFGIVAGQVYLIDGSYDKDNSLDVEFTLYNDGSVTSTLGEFRWKIVNLHDTKYLKIILDGKDDVYIDTSGKSHWGKPTKIAKAIKKKVVKAKPQPTGKGGDVKGKTYQCPNGERIIEIEFGNDGTWLTFRNKPKNPNDLRVMTQADNYTYNGNLLIINYLGFTGIVSPDGNTIELEANGQKYTFKRKL